MPGAAIRNNRRHPRLVAQRQLRRRRAVRPSVRVCRGSRRGDHQSRRAPVGRTHHRDRDRTGVSAVLPPPFADVGTRAAAMARGTLRAGSLPTDRRRGKPQSTAAAVGDLRERAFRRRSALADPVGTSPAARNRRRARAGPDGRAGAEAPNTQASASTPRLASRMVDRHVDLLEVAVRVHPELVGQVRVGLAGRIDEQLNTAAKASTTV